MARVHLAVASTAGTLLLFGLGTGTANVPVLNHQYISSRPMYSSRPVPGAKPLRYFEGLSKATFMISGTFGWPTADYPALDALDAPWLAGTALTLSIPLETDIRPTPPPIAPWKVEGLNRWVIINKQVQPTVMQNGVPIEFEYDIMFEEV